MEKKFLPFLLILYLFLVTISIFSVTGPLLYDFQKKRPYLVDKRWKRMAWLLSCLFLIPAGIILLSIPLFIFNEIKAFLQEKKGP
jgi:hypothetical protein